MRSLYSIAIAFCLLTAALADDPPNPEPNPPPPPPAILEQCIPGLQPPCNNLLFVVDTSGSMDGRRVADAIQTAISIAETPMDDLQIAIVTFGSSVRRWPGTEDINPQTNQPLSRNRWSLMPSKPNLDAAFEWMQNNRDSASTNITAALAHAFDSCAGGDQNETVKELSIIVISDGEFSSFDAIKYLIKQKQEDRVKKHLSEATLGFFGIDVKIAYDTQIRDLVGQLQDGAWFPGAFVLGYFKLVYPPVIIEEEEQDN